MRKQEAEQRLTLFFRDVHNARGEPFVHKQRLFPRDRMGTHYRMQQRGMFCDRIQPALVFLFAFAVLVFLERFFEVMLRSQATQQRPERCGQRLKGRNAAGPQRIAPGFRQQFCRQNRARGRRLDKGHVRMPVVIIGRVIVMGVQNNDFLHPFRMRVNRVDMQVAKTQGQRALLLWGNGLLAQEHHLMAQHRMVQLLKLVIAQRTGYVQA